MSLLEAARNFYRAHAHRCPALFNWQQHEMAIAKSRLRYVHESDFRVLADLKLPPRPFVVDVGANFGQSIGSTRAVLDHPRIAAFEPNPVAFRRVARRYKSDRNIEIYNLALGRQSGRIEFSIPVCRGIYFDQLANIGTINPANVAAFLQEKGYTWATSDLITVEKTTVEVRTLDEFVFAPDVIKIDVEGTEYDVLQGGLATIERFKPVLLIEAGERPQIVKLLRDRGYERYLYRDGKLSLAGSQASLNSLFLTNDHL